MNLFNRPRLSQRRHPSSFSPVPSNCAASPQRRQMADAHGLSAAVPTAAARSDPRQLSAYSKYFSFLPLCPFHLQYLYSTEQKGTGIAFTLQSNQSNRIDDCHSRQVLASLCLPFWHCPSLPLPLFVVVWTPQSQSFIAHDLWTIIDKFLLNSLHIAVLRGF